MESKQSSALNREVEQLQVMEYGNGGTRHSHDCSGKHLTEVSPCTHCISEVPDSPRAGFTCATQVPRAHMVMSGVSWMYHGAQTESVSLKT